LRAAPVGQVFEGRKVFVERDLLGHDAQQAARGGAFPHHVVAHDADMAGGGREETGDAADSGGFAGAVGSQETEDLAGLRGERDVVDGGDLAVSFAELVDCDHCG